MKRTIATLIAGLFATAAFAQTPAPASTTTTTATPTAVKADAKANVKEAKADAKETKQEAKAEVKEAAEESRPPSPDGEAGRHCRQRRHDQRGAGYDCRQVSIAVTRPATAGCSTSPRPAGFVVFAPRMHIRFCLTPPTAAFDT
jgi:hypothetical protein